PLPRGISARDALALPGRPRAGRRGRQGGARRSVPRALAVVVRLALVSRRQRDQERLAEGRSNELQPHRQTVGPEAAWKEDRGNTREIAGRDEPDIPGSPVRGGRRARRRRRAIKWLSDRRCGYGASDGEDHVDITEHRVERVLQPSPQAHGVQVIAPLLLECRPQSGLLTSVN